ncbi:uncharacterized protein LOC125497553 [Beta vulgaris subsp. vulgaris]|uniref:uncharacterized protein LOC125497553 n=1 Tax=Beta vulgaris subsp. vulgaris TaxID=3555 RepID=UPI002036C332|nr:uncharacterized protein LOC125497553 [Beta vulgaris subsp. vulgaris]
MAKVSKKGNGGQKVKQLIKVVKKPHTVNAKKMKNVNKISENVALSWTSEQELDDDSVASVDYNALMLDRANFEAARSQLASWVARMRTPAIPASSNMVNPSPQPLQQLASHTDSVAGELCGSTYVESDEQIEKVEAGS